MTQQYLEELSESRVRKRMIKLTPSADVEPRANDSFVLDVDYSEADPDGVSLPLILEINGPSPGSYVRREFLRVLPQTLVITPKEGGDHMVTLKEAAHNRWFGSYGFTATGPSLFRT